jgi:hypothetical protein
MEGVAVLEDVLGSCVASSFFNDHGAWGRAGRATVSSRIVGLIRCGSTCK